MTAPISNGPTTHGYTTMRDTTPSGWNGCGCSVSDAVLCDGSWYRGAPRCEGSQAWYINEPTTTRQSAAV